MDSAWRYLATFNESAVFRGRVSCDKTISFGEDHFYLHRVPCTLVCKCPFCRACSISRFHCYDQPVTGMRGGIRLEFEVAPKRLIAFGGSVRAAREIEQDPSRETSLDGRVTRGLLYI